MIWSHKHNPSQLAGASACEAQAGRVQSQHTTLPGVKTSPDYRLNPL